MSVDLEDYSIYRPHKSIIEYRKKTPRGEKILSGELASLHEIDQRTERVWYFDAIINYGNKKAYVQHVPFEILSIGGYEDRHLDTVGSNIWIQSIQGKEANIWYKIKSPACEYRRFHEAFLWMADFSKHVVDYLYYHDEVCLENFKLAFSQWLRKTHGSNSKLESWQNEYGDTDYRRAVAAHSFFLYNQALQMDKKYASHPLWSEIDWEILDAVPLQVGHQSKNPIEKTVVTPFVYECFKHLPWAKLLDSQPFAPAVARAREKHVTFESTKPRMAFTNLGSHMRRSRERAVGDASISVGDVVAVPPDKNTKWRTKDDLWYGYVQDTTDLDKGQALGLIWLYRPSDTACQKMKYPFENELFFSDHCNCEDQRIYASEVIQVPRVLFFASSDDIIDKADYFVRQRYLEAEQSWVTLCESDFQCRCKRREPINIPQYEVGDTLLVLANLPTPESSLEPVELIEKFPSGQDSIKVRLLPRKGRDYGADDAEPNELVYTDIFEIIKTENIIRRCHIRFFTEEDQQQRRISPQYRRQGTADFFYIIHQNLQAQGVESGLTALSRPWPSLKQGWDCATTPTEPVMRGLDIFCGGGNLGRGLEEGGAVKFQWAVDYFKEAIHTYRANLRDPNDAKLFYGSVNLYLRQAFKGTDNELVASPGSVEMISAGSPCQGFSNANLRKWNDRSLLNISMVASVVAFVDFYRPKYALLENVASMAKCSANDEDPNIFAQVLCALVGIGYQVQPFIMDAWNFGSPQSRTRLFISIAAPGMTPLADPPHSHSHPANIVGRSLGRSANGSLIAARRHEITPFEFVTIGQATKDLPLNYDGLIDCIPFPDHRPGRNMSTVNRIRISCIPRFPASMTFVKAAILGLMPRPQMETFNWDSNARKDPKISRSWRRVNPDTLMSTVITRCQPEDGINGSWVHWDACRCITVMEVRRAQGFPDHEVIIGSPARQWKIVGNSVARPVAFALGMALREAWLTNLESSPPENPNARNTDPGTPSRFAGFAPFPPAPRLTDNSTRNCAAAAANDDDDPSIGTFRSVDSDLDDDDPRYRASTLGTSLGRSREYTVGADCGFDG